MSRYSRLETAVAEAGRALRTTALGKDLIRFQPGRRASAKAPMSLADFELSLGIPGQRAIHVLSKVQAMRFKLDTTGDREYLEWVLRLLALAQSVADRAWNGIPAEFRTAFVDWEDAPPFAVQHYISQLRTAHSPNVKSAARSVGLGPDDLRGLAEVANACRSTPAFEAARAAALGGRIERRFLDRQRERRGGQVERLTVRGGSLIDVERAIRQEMGEIEKSRNTFERAMSAYGQLVNHALSATMAWAEREVDLAPVDPLDYPVAIEYAQRSFKIHITTQGEYWHLKPAAPFEVQLDGPIDGIYICEGYALIGLGEGGFADLYGLRLKDLEEAPDAV